MGKIDPSLNLREPGCEQPPSEACNSEVDDTRGLSATATQRGFYSAQKLQR
jgi:hypothetical protein